MSSAEYWKRREAANLASNLKDEKAYKKELDRIYKDMLDACQKEIDSFYGRYADKEGISIATAKKRVSKLDIEAYERKAERYVKEKNFSKQANEEMRLYNLTMKVNRLEMLKANIGLELIAGHDELNTFMEKILKGRTEDELKRQAGILGKSVRNNAKLVNSIVNGDLHNAKFSQRLWANQSDMKADLSKMLERGMIQGKNARTLTKELRKYFIGDGKKVGKNYATERLMITELARVQTEAQKQSFIANGFDEYIFIVNGGCCDICAGLAGKHFKVDKMMPGENAPPIHCFCRCSTSAYEDSTDYEEWLNFLEKGGTTEAWNNRRSSGANETENGKNIESNTSRSYNRARNRNAFKAIPYKDYTEPMTKKHVRAVMKEMGVSYGKARITLVHNDELIGTGLFGYTNPNGKEVQLYPDAFMSREELVKTIGHEKVHLDQLKKYGPTNDANQGGIYEKEARDSETRWWEDYKKVTWHE